MNLGSFEITVGKRKCRVDVYDISLRLIHLRSVTEFKQSCIYEIFSESPYCLPIFGFKWNMSGIY